MYEKFICVCICCSFYRFKETEGTHEDGKEQGKDEENSEDDCNSAVGFLVSCIILAAATAAAAESFTAYNIFQKAHSLVN